MIGEILSGSTGAFLITFRESLEAALIIGILAAYLVKTRRSGLRKYLWTGTAAAIVASVGLAGVLAVFYGGLSGMEEKLFEGTAAILATGVLSYMIFWMAKHSREIKKHLQEKVDKQVSKGYVAGIAMIAFIAVFREGVETVLFLTALGTQSLASTLTGAAVGIILVVILSALVMKRIYTLNLQKVFTYSSILLIIFAAGLFGFGVHEFAEASQDMGMDLGILGNHAYDINPPEGDPFHEKGAVAGIASGLVGWDGNPEWARVIAYLGYWIVVGMFFLIKVRRSNVVQHTLLSK